MKNRVATTAPQSHAGVVFPLTGSERATQPAGRRIIASSTERVDTAASEAARDENEWFSHYPRHFRELTRLSAGVNASLIAADGLDAVGATMRFRRQGAEGSVMDAIAVPRAHYFTGVTIDGTAAWTTPQLELADGDDLVRGDSLLRLLDDWDDTGLAEPSTTEALRLLAATPEWLDLRGHTFVLLGAASEMGPMAQLLASGAHVVAVDLPSAPTWARLIDLARRSPGRLTVPVRTSVNAVGSDARLAELAGADVITEAPEVAAWLTELPGPLVVGDYVYAPGSAHVRASVAVDGIVAALLDRRKDVGLAYLATPTDSYAVPSEVVVAAQAAFRTSNPVVAMARGLGGSKVFRPNYRTLHSLPTGTRFGVFDGLILQQGANYALAKRIQRWRAERVRESGQWVSINVAPATRTRSVTGSRLLESAYRGSHRFGLHVFTPTASRRAMAALLVHDLRNERSAAHPSTLLESSMDLLADQALHGGMWRAPYAPGSVLGFAALTGQLSRRS
jgi:hypothetical protein